VEELLNGSKICFDGFAASCALYGMMVAVTGLTCRVIIVTIIDVVCCLLYTGTQAGMAVA
jgi:hypothetical protein